jgi:hypothetical protein
MPNYPSEPPPPPQDIILSVVFMFNCRELGNERAEKAIAFEKTRILEERLQTESNISQNNATILERIHAYILESEIGPKATLDYQALELQVSVKSKEHATLQVSTCLRKKR